MSIVLVNNENEKKNRQNGWLWRQCNDDDDDYDDANNSNNDRATMGKVYIVTEKNSYRLGRAVRLLLLLLLLL